MTNDNDARGAVSEAVEIRLRNGQTALISPQDVGRVSVIEWKVNGKGYACQKFRRDGGGHFELSMHRFILGLPANGQLLVDHINGNKLDNRRENLRICDKCQNGYNQGAQRNNTSGYKGVTRKGNRWTAQIRCAGRKIYVGSFSSAMEAAHAYNKAAVTLHGEFAVLNPIGENK